MLGERCYEGHIYEVLWTGDADAKGLCPSLLDDYSRPSALAEPSTDKRRGLIGRMTPGQIARAKQELTNWHRSKRGKRS